MRELLSEQKEILRWWFEREFKPYVNGSCKIEHLPEDLFKLMADRDHDRKPSIEAVKAELEKINKNAS